MNEEINKRIVELQKELRVRQQRLQQAQAVVQQETQSIISTNGGLIELKKLLEKKPEGKPKKKKKQN